MLVRYPDGIQGGHFYQKRAPKSRPSWIEVVELSFPSGRVAEEVVPRDAAALAWLANLACLELHPHPVRAEDLDHPDELRVDLDPVPGIEWKQVQEVAQVSRAVLDDFNLVGWPKTSGSRGIHICVRIESRWDFDDVRRAALALAREVERRAPELATSKWWKEERHGVFVDYNQNAKDRTVAAAYSVRPTPDARVSAPLTWDEVDQCEAADFTLASMPARFQKVGDLHAAIDGHAGSLDSLLELFERQGMGDAPWPPHYRKQAAEPPRVQPSKRKSSSVRETSDVTASRRKSSPDREPARGTTSRRTSSKPLIEIGRARRKEDALAGMERWRARHPQAAAHLQAADVLVDSMRGRYSTWTRIRVNLQHVPEELRPAQEPLDPDEKILSSS
jgi:DNA ligase D-like protein (predicted polymerase)